MLIVYNNKNVLQWGNKLCPLLMRIFPQVQKDAAKQGKIEAQGQENAQANIVNNSFNKIDY
jgi:hypothetical protein